MSDPANSQCPIVTASYKAASLILDTIEEAFNLIAPDGRGRAETAVAKIFQYYAKEALCELAELKKKEERL
jgi:hypothetical protein